MKRMSFSLLAGLAVFVAAANLPARAQTGDAKDSLVVTGDAAKRSLTKDELSGDTAEKIAHACHDFAVQHKFSSIVFILDPFGNVIHAHRMDGVRPVQFQSAMDKARTALYTRAATSVLAAKVANDPAAQIRARIEGLDSGAGGVPIIVNDRLIGAIGVAGSDPLDEPCAAAGLAAVGIAMPPTPTSQSTEAQPQR